LFDPYFDFKKIARSEKTSEETSKNAISDKPERLPWLEQQVEIPIFDGIPWVAACKDDANVTFFPFFILQKIVFAFFYLFHPVLQLFSIWLSEFCFFSLKFKEFFGKKFYHPPSPTNPLFPPPPP
jgi:hypothetical protein